MEKKKSLNEDKYMYVCMYVHISFFSSYSFREEKEEKKVVFLTEQVRLVPKHYLSLCLHTSNSIGFLLLFPHNIDRSFTKRWSSPCFDVQYEANNVRINSNFMIDHIVRWCLLDLHFLSTISYTWTSILYCRYSIQQPVVVGPLEGNVFFSVFSSSIWIMI